MLSEPNISYKPFWGICRPLNSWRANSPNPIQIYCAKVNEPNGPNEPDIIQLIKINPKITQIELANQLNLSRSTIKRILNRLQQQEIVIRKGSNRNGYWAVKE